ncbi:MAG: ABC transporter ATP-binding protein [bacterium]
MSMFYGIHDIMRNMIGMGSRSNKLRKNEFWAVDDVSFKIKKGEALGIIGPNGSGKTTILKMLNGIFWPDKGKITINGRTGALIAVGAGFHPQLTGRENIYINAAVLGMSKQELDKKFDSIVDFADIGDFLDTSIKYYSSGMFVRLGFAIAINCNPEILLVDEVLAVGDINFRAKCFDKIREFIDSGRTIVFVSHQLQQVERLCDNTILLINGQIAFKGKPAEAIDLFRSKFLFSNINKNNRIGSGEIIVSNIEFFNQNEDSSNFFKKGENINIRIYFHAKEKIENPIFHVTIHTSDGDMVTGIRTDVDCVEMGIIEGEGYVNLLIKWLNLLPGSYILRANILKQGGFFAFYDRHIKVYHFHVKGGMKVGGVCYLEHEWSLPKKNNQKQKGKGRNI